MQEASERTSSCDIAFITHNLGSFKLTSLNSANDDKTPHKSCKIVSVSNHHVLSGYFHYYVDCVNLLRIDIDIDFFI